MHWSTVVGPSTTTRDLHVVKNGNDWQVDWPISKDTGCPAAGNSGELSALGCDLSHAGDDWGAQDVEAPHVRIVDMHPVQRAEGVVLLGELLNEDVVPAYVSVAATLVSKDQKPIETEGSFDKISHRSCQNRSPLFSSAFPTCQLSEVGSVRMTPFSTLVSASADPVIEIENEKLNPAPDASLTGQLTNQSGQIANVAHVLGTFYDKAAK